MDNSVFMNRFQAPIVTGTPMITRDQQTGEGKKTESTADFKQILFEQLNELSEVSFSKHAVSRVMERNVDLSESSLSRLNDGVKLAEEKGLNEPLILIDSTAYIVNIKNNTVITTVFDEDLRGNVFTNIDGTVII